MGTNQQFSKAIKAVKAGEEVVLTERRESKRLMLSIWPPFWPFRQYPMRRRRAHGHESQLLHPTPALVVGEGFMPSRKRAGINPAPTVGACGRRPGEGDFRGNVWHSGSPITADIRQRDAASLFDLTVVWIG